MSPERAKVVDSCSVVVCCTDHVLPFGACTITYHRHRGEAEVICLAYIVSFRWGTPSRSHLQICSLPLQHILTDRAFGSSKCMNIMMTLTLPFGGWAAMGADETIELAHPCSQGSCRRCSVSMKRREREFDVCSRVAIGDRTPYIVSLANGACAERWWTRDDDRLWVPKGRS